MIGHLLVLMTGAVIRNISAAIPWDALALVVYLLLLTIGELAVTFVSPILVFPLHGGVIGLLALHIASLEVRGARLGRREPLVPCLLALLVIALIRVISLTLPLSTIEPAYRYLLAGVPMAVGGLLVARAAGYSLRDVGVVWRMWRMQVGVILVSIPIGLVEYAILRPVSQGGFPWTLAGIAPALSVFLFTGFPEELIFRGILQTATRPILGSWNWIYASLVFAALHIGYRSPVDLLFVFGVGLLYGWVFERSRSIVGTSIGHGVANVTLFFVAPNLPVLVAWLSS